MHSASQSDKTILSKRVRVCVCKIWTDVKLLSHAGGTGVTLVPVPTKTARSRSDIKGRRPFDVVPASNFIVHVNFLQWDVANPRTTSPIFMNMSTTSMVFWLIFESGLHFGILLICSRCSSRRSSLGHWVIVSNLICMYGGFSSHRIYMKILSCLVCVNHLQRCKTSNLLDFRYSVLGFVFISDLQGSNLMFAAHCPTKRAAFMTDMTLGRWSHVPAFSISISYRSMLVVYGDRLRTGTSFSISILL